MRIVLAASFATAAVPAQFPRWTEVRAYDPGIWGRCYFDEWRQVVFSFVPWRGDGAQASRLWACIDGEWVIQDARGDPYQITPSEIVFDRSRGRAVLCDRNGDGWLEHWEWDGGTWSKVHAPFVPALRSEPTLCWDERSGRVLFLADSTQGVGLWTFDGTTWTQVPTQGGPHVRANIDLEQDRSSSTGALVCRSGDEDRICEQGVWRMVAARTGPPADRPFRLIHDRTGSRLLLIAGPPSLDGRIETWRWNGGGWVRLQTKNAPALHGTFSTAEAPGGGVLVDGLTHATACTWRLRGDVWSPAAARQVDALGGLAFRETPRMVADARRGCIWMLRAWSFSPPASLWQGRGGRWYPSPAAPPFESFYAVGFARDERRDRLIAVVAPPLDPPGEIWECDGKSWQRVRVLPWSIQDAIACHDPLSGKTVCIAKGAPSTFLWNGKNLTVTPAQAPSGPLAMAFDPKRKRIVLYASDDPWHVYEWHAGSWLRVQPPEPPMTRPEPALFFDPTLGELALLSSSAYGYGSGSSWNGQRWAPAPKYLDVPPAGSFAAEWDIPSGCVVLHGAKYSRTRDLWFPVTHVLTENPASYGLRGTACGGVQPPRLLALGLPQIGTPLQLDLTTARASAPAAFLLGTGSAQIPFGPCTLYVDPMQPLHAVPARTNLHGVAELPLALPYDLALRGLALHAQAFVEDPNVAGTRIATSAALALRVGD